MTLPPWPGPARLPIGRGTHLCGVGGPTPCGMGPPVGGKWGAGPIDRAGAGGAGWPVSAGTRGSLPYQGPW